MKSAERDSSSKQQDELLDGLKSRFECHLSRHNGLAWAKLQARLGAKPAKLCSLPEIERTGSEPDVAGVKSGESVFMDCAPESPAGRRNVYSARQKLDVVNQTRSNLFGLRGQFTPELVAAL